MKRRMNETKTIVLRCGLDGCKSPAVREVREEGSPWIYSYCEKHFKQETNPSIFRKLIRAIYGGL